MQKVTLKNSRIVISSGSEESLTNQDSSSLSLLGMTAAKASEIILNADGSSTKECGWKRDD
ncbi:MAG: hypothetical protein KGY61_11805 [Desulfobacterales bacterium]|nr:hypothetical protein [Desulfobacterales bacterium]